MRRLIVSTLAALAVVTVTGGAVLGAAAAQDAARPHTAVADTGWGDEGVSHPLGH
jgi:hypothetical protein